MTRPAAASSPAPTASCHAGLQRGATASENAPVVVLVGSPNVGKSTLFNSLTGAGREIGNWPGTTVEVARGAWDVGDVVSGHEVAVVDLPGALTLDAVSPDEELTRSLLIGEDPPDLAIVVLDASHLARGLYLLAELRERQQRIVVALSMVDVAVRRGVAIDEDALSHAVGARVVPVDPRRGRGTDALAQAVAATLQEPETLPVEAVAEPLDLPHPPDPLDREDEIFAWVNSVAEVAVTRDGAQGHTWSDRIDRVAVAPVAGPLLFLAVMWVVFQITTSVAAPLQGWLDGFVSGPVSDAAGGLLGALGVGGTWFEGLVVDGLIAGVGMLLTFVPVMALMFMLLAVLESSGYLARAAVVTDRLMRSIGLPGRAFLPLIVGFGCNVPAISATRILPDARHRLLTSMLVPFTSCSARLAVYVLVGTAFFGDQAGNVVFGMYVLSIVLIVLVGLLLRNTLWRSMGNEPLVMDLPPYHLPYPRLVAAVTWSRVRAFLRTAGGIIVATVAAVWLLMAIPVSGGASFGQVPVEDSAYAAIARTAAPVFEPAGFGDWHATSALMTGFVAKEAVISSWAQTYATEEPEDPTTPGSLGDSLRADFEASSGGHTTAAVFAFLVFLLAYTPCIATLAAQRREIGTRWMLGSLALSMGVAYVLAVAVFQVGKVFT